MAVDCVLPRGGTAELIGLTGDIADKVLNPNRAKRTRRPRRIHSEGVRQSCRTTTYQGVRHGGAIWGWRIPRRRVAKLTACDPAMKVTTNAAQVFGGIGYTRVFRVERGMREAKITEIFERTSQIERWVVARGLND